MHQQPVPSGRWSAAGAGGYPSRWSCRIQQQCFESLSSIYASHAKTSRWKPNLFTCSCRGSLCLNPPEWISHSFPQPAFFHPSNQNFSHQELGPVCSVKTQGLNSALHYTKTCDSAKSWIVTLVCNAVSTVGTNKTMILIWLSGTLGFKVI